MISSGGIDLSIGSVIAFTVSSSAVILKNTDIHPLFAFALALAITTAFGALMARSSIIWKCLPSSSRWPHVPGARHGNRADDRLRSDRPSVLQNAEIVYFKLPAADGSR